MINDSYNSDLGSLDIALDFLYRRSQSKGLRRTLILSDILETGQNTPTLYRQVAQLVNSRGIERIIGVGNEISSCAARFNIEKTFYPDTAALIRAIQRGELRLENEIILIKGARKFGFDSLTEVLEKKVHETILEVNLGAMIANLNYYRGKLKPETKMVCMVKASAYGAGSYEIAKTLQEHHVDYLAVAVADEGSELRKAGITANIIIMNPEMTAFKTMFDYKLEPEVYSFHLLDALIKEAEKEGITNFPHPHKAGYRYAPPGVCSGGYAPADRTAEGTECRDCPFRLLTFGRERFAAIRQFYTPADRNVRKSVHGIAGSFSA